MDDGLVLHIGEGAYLDVVQIPPQHASIPNAHLHIVMPSSFIFSILELGMPVQASKSHKT